ncbi:MAG: hypothetical protein ACREKL_17035 [Chthoniobacterales bacterium]
MKIHTTILSLLAASGFAFAQTATVTQNYSGTVVSVSPKASTLVLSSENAEPVTYTYTKETQFVDADGNAVTYEAIHNDTPVSVEYVSDGTVRRVSRVILQPAVTKKTTTTTTTTKDDD